MQQSQGKFSFRVPVVLSNLCINGNRLTLRSIEDAYAAEIFEEFTDEITRYMNPSPPKNIAETQAFISKTAEGMREGEDLVCVILKKHSEEFLGCCGFHGRCAPSAPELGIWLKKRARGNGYGREAIASLVGWAVQHVDFEYLTYPVDRANLPSRKIPESLGGSVFKEEKVRKMNGEFLDEVIYRIPRSVLLKGHCCESELD